jgi:hypothetical protein
MTSESKGVSPEARAVRRYGIVGVAGGLAGCKNGCLSSAGMIEQREGGYVLASDYDALARTVEELRAALADTRDLLAAAKGRAEAYRQAWQEQRAERDSARAALEKLHAALADLNFDGVAWPMCSHDISKVHVPMYMWNKLRAAFAALATDTREMK